MTFTTKADYWKKRAFDKMRSSVNQLGADLREVKDRLAWGGWDTAQVDTTISDIQASLEKLVQEIENAKEKSEEGEQLELPFGEESEKTAELPSETKNETETPQSAEAE